MSYQCNSVSDDEIMMVEEDKVDIEQHHACNENPESTIITVLDQLRQIFPQRPEMELRAALECCATIDDAIDSLFGKVPGENGKY